MGREGHTHREDVKPSPVNPEVSFSACGTCQATRDSSALCPCSREGRGPAGTETSIPAPQFHVKGWIPTAQGCNPGSSAPSQRGWQVASCAQALGWCGFVLNNNYKRLNFAFAARGSWWMLPFTAPKAARPALSHCMLTQLEALGTGLQPNNPLPSPPFPPQQQSQ